jgi:hypothetical protein
MIHETHTETAHVITFTDAEAEMLGQWLLEACAAMDEDMIGRLPQGAAIRELIGDLANHLNGVD